MENNFFAMPKYQKIIFWFFAAAMALPILLLPPNFQSSDWARAMLLRTIVAVLAIWLAMGFFLKKDFSFSLPTEHNPARRPLLALLVYGAIVGIATIFSQDPYFSFFGSPTRAGGFLSFIFYITFCLMLGIFAQKETFEKLIKVNFAMGGLIGLLALVQYLGLLKHIFIPWQEGGPPATLGNSTILATYFLFLTLAAFAFFLQASHKNQKILYGALGVFFIATIFVSGSRATYLALLVSTIYFFWRLPQKTKIAKQAVAGLFLLAVALIIVFNVFPNLGEQNMVLRKFQARLSLPSAAKDLINTRGAVWAISLKAIQDKPWLGYGPENFYIGFEKYYKPNLAPGLEKTWWDMPHNVWLEIWANSGIFSLVVYIAFWALLFWQLERVKKTGLQTQEKTNTLALQGMIIGYQIILFFNFDTFPTYLISFFFVGWALCLLKNSDPAMAISPPSKTLFAKPLVVIFSIIASMGIIAWSLLPLIHNEKITSLAMTSCDKNLSSLLEETDWSNMGILAPHAALQYTETVRKCAAYDETASLNYAKKAVHLLKKAASIRPDYSRIWLYMGGFANVLASSADTAAEKEKLLNDANVYLKKGIGKSPGRQDLLVGLAKNYLVAQDYPAMEKTAKDCIAIDDSLGECYWHLGISQIFRGQQDQGQANIDLALKKNYSTPSYVQLAIAYLSQKNYAKALDAHIHIPSPANPDAHAKQLASRAYLYQQTKNYAKAGQEAIGVFRLQPQNTQTLPFIHSLVALNPNEISLYYYLAEIYHATGQLQQYRQALEKIASLYVQYLDKNPQDTTKRFYLAQTYKNLGDWQRARQQALIIAQLEPSQSQAMQTFTNSLNYEMPQE